MAFIEYIVFRVVKFNDERSTHSEMNQLVTYLILLVSYFIT